MIGIWYLLMRLVGMLICLLCWVYCCRFGLVGICCWLLSVGEVVWLLLICSLLSMIVMLIFVFMVMLMRLWFGLWSIWGWRFLFGMVFVCWRGCCYFCFVCLFLSWSLRRNFLFGLMVLFLLVLSRSFVFSIMV